MPADSALYLLEVLSQYPSDERPLLPPTITKTLFVLWPRSLPPSAADPDSSEGLAHVERLTAALRRLVERFYTTTRQRMWVLQILMQGVAMDVELEEPLLPSFMRVLGTVSGQLLSPAERTTVVLDTFPRLLAGTVATFGKPRAALAPWRGALWKDPAGHAGYSESKNGLLLLPPLFETPLSQRVPRAGIGAHLGHWVRQAFAPLGEARMGEMLRFLMEDVTILGPDLPSYAHKEAADLIKAASGRDGTRAMVQAMRRETRKSVRSYLMEEQ